MKLLIEAKFNLATTGTYLQATCADGSSDLVPAMQELVRRDGFSDLVVIDATELPEVAKEDWAQRVKLLASRDQRQPGLFDSCVEKK